MYKAVIFDFYGVFCASIASNWFKKTVPDYEAKSKAFEALCTQSDLGQISRAEFNAALAALTGVPADEVAKGIEAETAIDTELVAYVQQLRKNYRIACLSNGGHEWTLQTINENNLGSLFDEIVLSADLGIVKPDPRIYKETLERLGVTSDEAIFIDDRQVNVEGAEACGIRGLLFRDTPSFIADFELVTS